LTASLAAQAAPVRRVTAAEVDQLVAAAQGQPDGKIAKQLSGIKLTERASAVRLARWQAQLPGKRCRTALTLLADTSAFLDLPAADMPADAPPDLQTQKAMLNKTIEYVSSTITRLPDFYATRSTEHFEDTPDSPVSTYGTSGRNLGLGLRTSQPFYEPLHNTGKSSATISYVAGHELLGSKKDTDSLGKPALELTSHGEFGAILVVVLLDAAKGRLSWGNWERDANGVNAVYRYAVRQGHSSYAVVLPHGLKNDSLFPAYHGEIAVDPATGTVMRISVVADLVPPDDKAISSIMVEFGPVSIGGKSYICPVHSVALARIALGDPLLPETRMQMQLNDVVFINYHLFHTESRIITGVDLAAEPPPAPPK
jgi:hypothetical protein